jgi:hypothetical protein
MASPTYRSNSVNSISGSAATSIDAGEPAGAANGDGLLCVCVIEKGTSSPGVVTMSAAWTFVGSVATSEYTAYIWYARRGGSAPSYVVSWTVGLDGTYQYAEATAIAVSGVSSTGAVLSSFLWGATGSGTVVNGPGIYVPAKDSLAVSVATNWGGYFSPSAPTGYTRRTGTGGIDTAIATKAVSAVGAEDPGNWGASNASGTMAGWTGSFCSVMPLASSLSMVRA